MRALVASLALVAGLGSLAHADSPRNMLFEFHGGGYLPLIDEGLDNGTTPYKDVFGDDSMTLLRIHIDYELWQEFGTLAVGGGIGYGWNNGKAIAMDGTKSEDDVGFNIAPITLSLIYRWDWAAVKYSVPFVPYAKVGLTGILWWATDASDDIANARGPDGEERSGAGLTVGWHVSGGLQFLLDIFSSSMATQFDEESGVNNSYIFVEFTHSQVDDFGSDSSIDLSADSLSFGLAFEF